MTSHLLETVRDIPLNEKQIPHDIESSGFPFDDRDFDRDRSHSSFRSQLDDLAKRHPEFAEHLNIGGGFPFRSHTLGRHRRGSDTGRSFDAEKPSGSQDTEFRRYPHDRPFSRFDNFDFRKYFDEDEPDFYEPAYRGPEPQPSQQHAYTNQPPAEEQQKQKSQPSSPQPAPTGTAEKPPPIPHPYEGRKQNIQQSNTVDLGQKQEPVDENRGQRSMSAPPENRSTGQRFVSSIHIPIQRPSGGGGDMGAKASTPTAEPQQQTNKPNERVIPIHVEGRDEPIIPKNVNPTFTQPPPQQQSEKLFGRNPSHFTQFVNKEPMNPEDHYRQQQQQYQKQQQQNFQQQQQQQNRSQEEEQPQYEPPPQSQSAQTATQLDQIQNIQKDVSELMNQVEKFNGKPRDKQYLYLDEMLTRNLIKLDNIETEGKDNIRQARKEAIKCIEGCIGILDAKANANVAFENQNKTAEEGKVAEAEKQLEEAQIENTTTEKVGQGDASATNIHTKEEPVTSEVSGVTRTGSAANVIPMEVVDETKQEVPPLSLNETLEKKEEVTLPTDTQQKPEENKDAELKKEGGIPGEEAKNSETSVEKMEVSSATEASQKQESENSDDKPEKKKGKKKEKTDKK